MNNEKYHSILKDYKIGLLPVITANDKFTIGCEVQQLFSEHKSNVIDFQFKFPSTEYFRPFFEREVKAIIPFDKEDQQFTEKFIKIAFFHFYLFKVIEYSQSNIMAQGCINPMENTVLKQFLEKELKGFPSHITPLFTKSQIICRGVESLIIKFLQATDQIPKNWTAAKIFFFEHLTYCQYNYKHLDPLHKEYDSMLCKDFQQEHLERQKRSACQDKDSKRFQTTQENLSQQLEQSYNQTLNCHPIIPLDLPQVNPDNQLYQDYQKMERALYILKAICLGLIAILAFVFYNLILNKSHSTI